MIDKEEKMKAFEKEIEVHDSVLGCLQIISLWKDESHLTWETTKVILKKKRSLRLPVKTLCVQIKT